MPPRKAKKTTSSSSSDSIPAFPAPPTSLPLDAVDRPGTPEPQDQTARIEITEAQKQALVDNLQLEITERARKLRAQYALQAQGLRSRLEMRVNRIPQALRKRSMQELIDEHAAKPNPKPAPPVPVQQNAQKSTVPAYREEEKAESKSLKRQSDQISLDEDKENAASGGQQPSSQDLDNPKKRPKTTTAATANTKATRTASRKVVPSNVLSPRSHNSRTLPRSPFKPAGAGASPEKPSQSRPGSPTKQAPAPAPAQQKQRAPSRQTKRAAPATATRQANGKENNTHNYQSRSSGASNSSAGTTIVTKPTAAAKPRGAAASKKAGAGAPKTTSAAVSKKAPAAAANAKREKAAAPAPAVNPGGRTLRKRN